MKTFIVSLGGSLISPGAEKVDVAFLKKFRALILKHAKQGNRFALIVGGGKVCRIWQDAARYLQVNKDEDIDWIGIRATQMNAELIRAMFGKAAYPHVVCDPREKVTDFKILIGAGYETGSSSDYDAVIRAKTLRADTVINLSNVSFVYDKDPKLFKNVKPLAHISWNNFFKMFGKKWKPGSNVPFDPIAAKTASSAGIKVIFIGGKNLKNFENFLQGKGFNGTMIG